MHTPRSSVRTPCAAAVAALAVAGGLSAASAAGPPPAVAVAPHVAHEAGGCPKPLITALRAQRVGGRDRLVFTISGRATRPRIRSVPEVTRDPSGKPLPLEGRSFMVLFFDSATTVCFTTPPGYRPPRGVTPRFPLLRQAKLAGDQHFSASFGVGLSRPARARAWTSGNRVIVEFRGR